VAQALQIPSSAYELQEILWARPSASQLVNRSNGYSDIGSLRESIMNVIRYGRRSTAEQASNGVSIEVQRRAVERVA
jgi:hypothetical protein